MELDENRCHLIVADDAPSLKEFPYSFDGAVVSADPAFMNGADVWCRDHLTNPWAMHLLFTMEDDDELGGGQYVHSGTVFRFQTEEDAMLFRLRF